MAQRQLPESNVDPHLETPVIDMQDLEHKADSRTRVNNKGVKIEPTFDSDEIRDFAKEDEAAIDALEEIEKSIRGQLPG